MKKYYSGNYNIKLNLEENEKLKKVRNHYIDTGIKKIFMSMVNAMFSKIPIEKIMPTNTMHEEEKE